MLTSPDKCPLTESEQEVAKAFLPHLDPTKSPGALGNLPCGRLGEIYFEKTMKRKPDPDLNEPLWARAAAWGMIALLLWAVGTIYHLTVGAH